MNTTNKISKFLANRLSNVATHVAYKSTKSCGIFSAQEPKIPQCLLKKEAVAK